MWRWPAASHFEMAQPQHQHHGVKRRSLKPVANVELFGGLMQCVHNQCTNPGVLRYVDRTADGILEQRASQLHSLGTLIDCEPR